MIVIGEVSNSSFNYRMRISMEISGHFALRHYINMAVSVADKIFILR